MLIVTHMGIVFFAALAYIFFFYGKNSGGRK